MGKRNTEPKYGGAKILFKKSNNTIFTHSRTCSGVSQIYTRSGILQIKKNLSQAHEYYRKGDKVKRDLSIETDVCILRRYYKSKKNRLSNQDGSAKSKYSTVVDTEIDPIEEFKPDASACGDSEHTEIIYNDNTHLNITALMVDNLKSLMNRWIERHLLENEDTKEKIETVLDSILHKMELKRSERVSSRSTYILNKDGHSREVKNKKIETASITCQYCKHKSRPIIVNSSSSITYNDLSCQSAPFALKKLRIVSTLSIPKSMNKTRNKTGSEYKVKKTKHKNVMLSIDRSSKLLDCSSFDLLAISTKSLTKRFATYDTKNNRKRRIIFYPKPFYKSASNTTETEEKEEIQYENEEFIQGDTLGTMPSLVKSIYADDPANVTSTERAISLAQNNDNFTLTDIHNLQHNIVSNSENVDHDVDFNDTNCTYNTNNKTTILNERDQSEPLISIDFINRSLEFPNITKTKTDEFSNKYYIKSKINNYRKKLHIIRKRKKHDEVSKFQKIRNRNFTLLYKKINDQSYPCELLNHFKNILKFYAEQKDHKNIKLDIQVNVFPMYDKATKNECTNVSNESINDKEIAVSAMAIYNNELATKMPSTCIVKESVKDNINFRSAYNPNIIPLLDGSASQANYIFSKESSTTKSIASKYKNQNVDHGTFTSDLQIAKEIHELKSVIKELAVAADKYVNEQLKKEYIKAQKVNSKVERLESPKVWSNNPSKGIQISNDFARNLAGLKLSKEPKNNAFEFFNRLTKRSTSYNVIESESILQVTDMTVVNEKNYQKFINKALTCSLPKSRSLFEMTTEKKKRKVMAYFCESCKKQEICDGCCSHASNEKSHSRSMLKTKNCKVNPADLEPSYCGCSQSGNNIPSYPKSSECSSTSIIDNDEERCCDSTKLLDRGMSFGEGLIYCLLLWIPVIIITILFYRFVIKDMIHGTPALGMLREDRSVSRKNETTSTRQRTKMHARKTKEDTKRTHSGTRYPKQLPTYVVAFAMQETYDDLITAQHIICNKRSPEGSSHSITATSTLENFDNTNVEKLSNNIIDMSENITSTKTKVIDNCGDIEKSLEAYNEFVVDDKIMDKVHEQSEVIFNATTYERKYKDISNKFPRRTPKKYKRVGKFTNVHFKYKNSKNTTKRKFEYYCKKSKRNGISCGHMQKGLCSNLSNLVSRSRILKKVIARENLLDKCTSFFDEINSTNEAPISSNLTTEKTSISNLSGNTLNLKESSSSSRNDDYYSISAVNSVIQISSDNMIPYKTDVISVAVAVAYNSTNLNNTTKMKVIPSKEKLLFGEDLTSTETIVLPAIALTSKTLTEQNETNNATEDNVNDYTLDPSCTSENTLIGDDNKSSFEISSDDDTFVIAKTSSDFNNSSIVSDFTLMSNSENKLNSQRLRPTFDKKDMYKRAILLDTVINLGIFSDMTPSTSSTGNFNEDFDEVVIMKELKPFPLTPQNKGDQHSRDIEKELSKNILMKSIELERNIGAQRNFNLPNEAIIKEKLKENEKSQRESYFEEFTTYPTSFSEMWDKLILVLDLAVKRLEELLSDKILREIKKSLAVFEQYKLPITKEEIPDTIPLALEIKSEKAISNKEKLVQRERIKIESDACLQCDLVENHMIDQLMMKSSLERPKLDVPISTKTIDNNSKTKIFRDYFEVLKPPATDSPTELMKGDTVTVSTTTPKHIEEIRRLHRLKVLFAAPANFVKENVFIISSVPTFLALLLCIYGLIVLVMKPW